MPSPAITRMYRRAGQASNAHDEKRFERARVAAVDRAERIRTPGSRPAAARRAARPTRGRGRPPPTPRRSRRTCSDLLERGDEGVAVARPVEMAAQVVEDGPFLRRRAPVNGMCSPCASESGPALSARLPNSCGVCGSCCDGSLRADGLVTAPAASSIAESFSASIAVRVNAPFGRLLNEVS